MTECKPEQLSFGWLGRREVVASFEGGQLSSDGGALLLAETDARIGLIDRLADCFIDGRVQPRVEHPLRQMVAQRVLGLALGYEDLNDHDALRRDPVWSAVSRQADVLGERRSGDDVGCALAGKSTLNRLEGSARPSARGRYKKIVPLESAMDELLVTLFIESFTEAPASLTLDVDATDDPLHGHQEGRFFHGYYDSYCYLPLYIFCGEQVLCARLRTANQDGAAGTQTELARIVTRLRAAWPTVQIIVRGDSGFCRDALLSWCEASGVDYIIGLAKNQRLKRAIGAEAHQAAERHAATQRPARVFAAFRYRTHKSWSGERWVVGKAEHLPRGENPRFIVTTLLDPDSPVPLDEQGRRLYEQVYCARGEMENRIKEQQLWLFADRTSCAAMASNQLRLYFSSFAYCLMQALRRLGLAGTALEKAQCGTLREKLLKVGARVRVSVRKLWVSLPTAYPYAEVFIHAYRQLQRIPLRI